MKLSSITTGKIRRPIRAVVYGVEGVGKSSFCAAAPDAVFIGAEDGTSQLDVARFPQPSNFGDIMSAICELYDNDHDFKTLVIDSADWAQKLCFAAVAKEGGQNSIEGFGYGKGYAMAAERYMQMMRGLDALVNQGMNVLIVAHSQIATFQDPAGDSYDHYTIACDKRINPMLKEWADAVLFADFDKSTKQVGEGFNKRVIAKSYGARVMYTEHRASHDAKNRYNLPERMPLDWPAFIQAVDEFYANGKQKKQASKASENAGEAQDHTNEQLPIDAYA